MATRSYAMTNDNAMTNDLAEVKGAPMTNLAEVELQQARKRLREAGEAGLDDWVGVIGRDILTLLDATEPKPLPAGMEERIAALPSTMKEQEKP